MQLSHSALKDKAIYLRRKDRLTDKEICDRIDGAVHRSTINRWLKDHPLTKDEMWEKRSERQYKAQHHRVTFYSALPNSSYWEMVDRSTLTRQQKGKIAESAITFRCSLHGHAVFVSPFDGDTADRLVQTSSGKLLRLQVRWCQHGKSGSPMIRLTSRGSNGRIRRFQKGDFDFIVGYDLRTDKSFVFSWEETEDLSASVSITEESMEAWHKLL